AELRCLWETDLLRPRRPTVLEEVARGLYFMRTLWEVVPVLYDDLARALDEAYPGQNFRLPTFLRFGSWMGGDRDGNPFVTALVTLQSLELLRQAALKNHLRTCRELFGHLTQSSVRVKFSPELRAALDSYLERFPALGEKVAHLPTEEVYRRWLVAIAWRLEQAVEKAPGAYARADQLERDLALLESSLLGHRPGHNLEMGLRDWLIQVRVFGFHFARLDVRQHSGVYQAMAGEILSRCGLCDNFAELDEPDRVALLNAVLKTPLDVPHSGWSEATREGLSMFAVLNRRVEEFGPEVLGAHVISMTHNLSDVLTVLWLQRLGGGILAQPIVPLLETIDDLRRGPDILTAMFENPHYRDYLERQQKLQFVMIGYSDSTKDGGYLAANWWLYKAQDTIRRTAAEHQVRMVLFHGRGGALGRGGGPAARSILSLPPEVARAGLRVTEQGEVLSERYDDPQVAYRHLEQLTWAMVKVRSEPSTPPEPEWLEVAERMASNSLQVYRELLEQPGFVDFFSTATPVGGIEKLQLGSRPSRRKGQKTLADLRAIPWVFAWTQSRVILPAWFGLGSAFVKESTDLLRDLYDNWRFFRATVNNAVLAMAKADMDIGRHYAQRAGLPAIWERIEKEYERSHQALLEVTRCQELLDD
ncbi:MAG: phosphoenolpyruvate carboxylase, partial [Candidatus Eremiobacteraeota bacterium]|nr:phosphoenolpyruvate carboxylase [Candidatus Eremiobacteraeota bacterium]